MLRDSSPLAYGRDRSESGTKRHSNFHRDLKQKAQTPSLKRISFGINCILILIHVSLTGFNN